jgi:hypothetical protein
LDFWFENKPSGNPAQKSYRDLKPEDEAFSGVLLGQEDRAEQLGGDGWVLDLAVGLDEDEVAVDVVVVVGERARFADSRKNRRGCPVFDFLEMFLQKN